MAWDVLSGAAKMAWDVLSGVTKTAWDVLSGVANRCGIFFSGVSKNGMGCFVPGCFVLHSGLRYRVKFAVYLLKKEKNTVSSLPRALFTLALTSDT